MAVLQITSREFRDKQKTFFDLADKGEHIVIQRGKKKSYTITPIEEDDLFFTPQMLEKIDLSIQEAQKGEGTRISGKEELIAFLDSL